MDLLKDVRHLWQSVSNWQNREDKGDWFCPKDILKLIEWCSTSTSIYSLMFRGSWDVSWKVSKCKSYVRGHSNSIISEDFALNTSIHLVAAGECQLSGNRGRKFWPFRGIVSNQNRNFKRFRALAQVNSSEHYLHPLRSKGCKLTHKIPRRWPIFHFFQKIALFPSIVDFNSVWTWNMNIKAEFLEGKENFALVSLWPCYIVTQFKVKVAIWLPGSNFIIAAFWKFTEGCHYKCHFH